MPVNRLGEIGAEVAGRGVLMGVLADDERRQGRGLGIFLLHLATLAVTAPLGVSPQALAQIKFHSSLLGGLIPGAPVGALFALGFPLLRQLVKHVGSGL